jgi:hypothetical protein
VPAPIDLAARYRRYRETGKKLNSVMLERLSQTAIDDGVRDLDLLRGGILVFDSEDEMTVLMDYCLYNVPHDGRNTVQNFLADNPPPAGSDELLVLEAMSKAWFSLFDVTAVEPDVGMRVMDIFRETEHLLIDMGLSRSAKPGIMLATRAIPFDDFIMTSGVALPLGANDANREDLIALVSKNVFANNIASFGAMTPAQGNKLARTIISAALAKGALSRVRFEDPEEEGTHRAEVRSKAPRQVRARPKPADSSKRRRPSKSPRPVPARAGGRLEPNQP